MVDDGVLTLARVNFVLGIYGVWHSREYIILSISPGRTFQADSYNMTLTVIDHDLAILINGAHVKSYCTTWRL